MRIFLKALPNSTALVGLALLAAALLTIGHAGLSAQDATAEAQSSEPEPRVMRTLPALAPRHPQRARAQRVKTVDIPQWAKEEGHNGSATYVATVAPDGKLEGLRLKQSSNSEAIDSAVRQRAEGLTYFPATNVQGEKIASTVEVRMSYARYDQDSPGGGLDDYRCADLTREYDWYAKANQQRRRIFWLENAYTSVNVLDQLSSGNIPSRSERLKARNVRKEMWDRLIERCRKSPANLFLDEVEEREKYLRVAEGF